MKPKKRSIYVYETKLFKATSTAADSVTTTEDDTELKWNSAIIIDVLQHIINMDEAKRLLVGEANDWCMYLDGMKIITDDSRKPQYIQGYFSSAKSGLRTTLLNLHTFVKASNPKEPGQNELWKTHFMIRLSDGMLLLDNYSGNVVSSSRFQTYLRSMAQPVFDRYQLFQISIFHILSQGFIDKLNGFERISLAKLKVKVRPSVKYDTTDGFGHLQEEAKVTRANVMELLLRRTDSRKEGLVPEELKHLIQRYMNNSEVVAGSIQGKPSEGNPPEVRLLGIEEKHKQDFPTDAEGEVLTEHMFAYMLELGRTHSSV